MACREEEKEKKRGRGRRKISGERGEEARREVCGVQTGRRIPRKI